MFLLLIALAAYSNDAVQPELLAPLAQCMEKACTEKPYCIRAWGNKDVECTVAAFDASMPHAWYQVSCRSTRPKGSKDFFRLMMTFERNGKIGTGFSSDRWFYKRNSWFYQQEKIDWYNLRAPELLFVVGNLCQKGVSKKPA